MTQTKKELSESELNQIGDVTEVVNQISELFFKKLTIISSKDKPDFDERLENILSVYGKDRYQEGMGDGMAWKRYWKKTTEKIPKRGINT
jgi:hypothetical protein